MIVFEINKMFQKVIGLKSCGGGHYREYIVASIVSISMLLIFSMLSLNFVFNIHDDLNAAWSTLPLITAYLTVVLVHWHFLFNRNHFYSLFGNMEDIVNESLLKLSYRFLRI